MRKRSTIKGGGKGKRKSISSESRRVEMQRSVVKAREAKRNGQSFEFVPIEKQYPYKNSHLSNETRRSEKVRRASMKSASKKNASRNGSPKNGTSKNGSPKNS
jgi:hypothetical protein